MEKQIETNEIQRISKNLKSIINDIFEILVLVSVASFVMFHKNAILLVVSLLSTLLGYKIFTIESVLNKISKTDFNMKIWKITSGVFSIVISVFIFLQSVAIGAINTISENGNSSGAAGILVSIMLLSGGILSIVFKGDKGNGGNISLISLFSIGAFIGFSFSKDFSDLAIWSVWCVINALLAGLSLLLRNDAALKHNKY